MKFSSKNIFLLLFLIIIIQVFIIYEITIPDKKDYKCEECNVILISIDTLRADHLGSYGYERNTSPNIDAFADENIFFENFHVDSFNTIPSHATIFTGTHIFTHKMTKPLDDILDNKFKTIAEILKKENYTTTWFAPLNNTHLSLKHGFERGYDEFYNDLIDKERWNQAFDWISENKDKKFYTFLHTYSLHDPYLVPKEFEYYFYPEYNGSIIGNELGFFTKSTKNGNNEFFGHRNYYWDLFDNDSEEDVKQLISLYDAQMLCCVDPYIGELIELLKKENLYNNTIIVLTSDHGESFNEHGYFRHKTLYEENIFVPLIIHFPNLDAKKIDAQIQSVDILPTILDSLNIKIPSNVDGKSALHVVLGKEDKINDYIYGNWPSVVQSIISDEWKLIKFTNNEKELYNIKNDPHEKNNVINEYTEITKELENQLEEKIEYVIKDTYPIIPY